MLCKPHQQLATITLVTVSHLFAPNTSAAELFFLPSSLCKEAAIRPPVIAKTNRTQQNQKPWLNFDINGDGVCDRLRGGTPEKFSKVHEVIGDNLFLASPDGWLKYGVISSKYPSSPILALRVTADEGILPANPAYAFVDPIFIFKKEAKTPFILVSAQPANMGPMYPENEAPTFPTYRNIRVLQWDAKLHLLTNVSDTDRFKITQFVASRICGSLKLSLAPNGVPIVGGVWSSSQREVEEHICQSFKRAK